MPGRSVLLLWSLLICHAALAAERGHQPRVAVTEETRLDWVFALANQSPVKPPVDWLPGYRSTDQTYELFVPATYDANKTWPLILFISAGDQPAGFAQWRLVCEQEGLLFASPHHAGNNCDFKQRVRIVLEVLDDVRREYNVSSDRTYLGGFSGGGRVACAIGFALPEQFGGVIPVCAAGDLREEPWLRQRVIDRLSVAHLTGENDFNRSEIERFRGPMLADVGVRSKVWVTPKLGHGIPDAAVFKAAFDWLEEGLPVRQKLAKENPAARADARTPSDRQAQATALAAEAKQRIEQRNTTYSGLMQFKGILDRWPDLPEAAEARAVLLTIEQADDRSWEQDDIAEQRRFLVARARRLSAYAIGPLPEQYHKQRKDMASAAIELWKLVEQDGQDQRALNEAKELLPKLVELVGDEAP